MFSIVHSAALKGVEMLPVEIETDVSEGLPVMDMVGLLNSEVKESKERVRTAIKNTHIHLPPKRITINLSPADIRKEGGAFDLPIAIGILQSLGYVTPAYDMNKTLIIGELSLDGKIKPVKGVLAIASSIAKYGYERIIVPEGNSSEAAVIKNIEVIAVADLEETIKVLNDNSKARIIEFEESDFYDKQLEMILENGEDFSEVCGQDNLKRAAVIAASGRHNILLIGPPGSGKTMVSSRIAGILPLPDLEECIEITKIHSVAGNLKEDGLMYKRPFRTPHHTITTKAMAGGGQNVKPGEISLAHKGVLFLDEMAEYSRETLEVLRQPLESHRLIINRTSGIYDFPADIMLVAAMNLEVIYRIQINDKVRYTPP